ncbi:NfeD family protein [Methyloligella sp. 2.7D]|uniref:NfeD family protein n=1 Tax=unclassified Methyloligella TaxID=2625955 RepID=UPI00157C8137|nr:NfeD family protein [Methyloligella sp. GL2]QKP76754.1 NfeD family protein [Methyloligella sp. GL2]
MEEELLFGPWGWMVLAGVLFVLEVIAPGIFFMWFGLAAAITGLLVFGFDISWQWQLIWFGILATVIVGIVVRFLRRHPLKSERPLLNERAVSQIGKSYELLDPIVNGRGSVKIGDSVWRVTGPDLPAGTKVKVTGADGTLLSVEAAGNSEAA